MVVVVQVCLFVCVVKLDLCVGLVYGGQYFVYVVVYYCQVGCQYEVVVVVFLFYCCWYGVVVLGFGVVGVVFLGFDELWLGQYCYQDQYGVRLLQEEGYQQWGVQQLDVW